MTREEIICELREVEIDLLAFRESRDALQRRITSLEGMPRQENFVNWAATQVILNGLILAVVRCEGLIEDYRNILEEMDAPDNVVRMEKKP